jgi:cysteine desulfurase
VRLVPQMDGGGHESGLRSGTLNVPGIVGFGAACAIAASSMAEEARRIGALRDRLLALLQAGLDGVTVNGALAPRLPGNLNVRFAGVDAASLLIALPGVALSTGSACTSAAITPSHVLRALGLSEREASSSVRFGIGRFNTEAEIDDVAARVTGAVRRLRALAPV